MTDALRAAAKASSSHPTWSTLPVRVWRRWRSGEIEAAEACHRAVLPEIVFAMRGGVEHLVAYGKRIFAHRAGGLAAHDRSPCRPVTAFRSPPPSATPERSGPFPTLP